MAEIKSKAEELNQLIRKPWAQLGQKLSEAENLFNEFQEIEDTCADLDLSHCLSMHDQAKMQRAALLRQRHLIIAGFNTACVSPLPKHWNLYETIPIQSQADIDTASTYLQCSEPYLKKFLDSVDEEQRLFIDALRKLKAMVPHK